MRSGMERYNVDAVRAFALLTQLSSTQNVKMRDIAAELISSRRIPVLGDSDT